MMRIVICNMDMDANANMDEIRDIFNRYGRNFSSMRYTTKVSECHGYNFEEKTIERMLISWTEEPFSREVSYRLKENGYTVISNEIEA